MIEEESSSLPTWSVSKYLEAYGTLKYNLSHIMTLQRQKKEEISVFLCWNILFYINKLFFLIV